MEGPALGRAQHLVGSEAGHQALCDLLQDGVRAGTAQPAVQDDEVLDVEQRHRHLARLRGGHQGPLQRAVEPVAVGQAGEGVEAIASASVLARPLDRLAKRVDLAARGAQRALGLGEADEALGADGRDVPIERMLEQVGGPRLDGRPRLSAGPSRGRAPGCSAVPAAPGPPRTGRGRARRTRRGRSPRSPGGGRRTKPASASRDARRGRHLEPGGGQPPGRAFVRRAVRARHQGDALAPGRAGRAEPRPPRSRLDRTSGSQLVPSAPQ